MADDTVFLPNGQAAVSRLNAALAQGGAPVPNKFFVFPTVGNPSVTIKGNLYNEIKGNQHKTEVMLGNQTFDLYSAASVTGNDNWSVVEIDTNKPPKAMTYSANGYWNALVNSIKMLEPKKDKHYFLFINSNTPPESAVKVVEDHPDAMRATLAGNVKLARQLVIKDKNADASKASAPIASAPIASAPKAATAETGNVLDEGFNGPSRTAAPSAGGVPDKDLSSDHLKFIPSGDKFVAELDAKSAQNLQTVLDPKADKHVEKKDLFGEGASHFQITYELTEGKITGGRITVDKDLTIRQIEDYKKHEPAMNAALDTGIAANVKAKLALNVEKNDGELAGSIHTLPNNAKQDKAAVRSA